MVNFKPIIFSHLPNKKHSTYKRLFLILKQQFGLRMNMYKCGNESPTNPHWPPWWVMARSSYVWSIRKACAPAVGTLIGWWWWWCDYELAVIKAVKDVFPRIAVKGYYHFRNAVFKMAKKFNTNPEDQKIIKYWSLLLLSAKLMVEAFNTIIDMASQSPTKFLVYFNNQWMKKICSDILCCY
jgi:hypothetical protein